MADVTAGMITGKEVVEFLRFVQESPQPGCVTIDITLCGICGNRHCIVPCGHLHSPPVWGTNGSAASPTSTQQ